MNFFSGPNQLVFPMAQLELLLDEDGYSLVNLWFNLALVCTFHDHILALIKSASVCRVTRPEIRGRKSH